jgi:hypothetical protein
MAITPDVQESCSISIVSASCSWKERPQHGLHSSTCENFVEIAMQGQSLSLRLASLQDEMGVGLSSLSSVAQAKTTGQVRLGTSCGAVQYELAR